MREFFWSEASLYFLIIQAAHWCDNTSESSLLLLKADKRSDFYDMPGH